MKGGPNRERELGRLLGRMLGGRVDTASAPCPDAETLAAWVGGRLTTVQGTGTEAHVADCAHCQALLATMARMPSALPTSAPGWSVGRVLAWLVPLTAGAAAIALWIRVQPDALVSVQPPMSVSAESRTSHAPLLDTPPSAAANEPPNPPAQAAKQRRVEAPAPPHDLAGDVAREVAPRKQERLSERDRGTAQGGMAGAMAMKAPAAPAAAPPIAEGAPVVGGASRIESAKAASTLRIDNVKVGGGAVVDIETPDASIRWRITGGRLVERSTDGGSNWETQSTGVASPLTAGASPAPSVCWLVGRGAVVLLLTDGHSWRRLAFPEAVDLVAVRAVDATTASVTTAAGRTFTTRDGGLTWVATALQESPAAPY